ncbi:MAG TPA: ATP-binding protein [Flavobacteriaceae bacterium]|nr:ATP-binding protein [Flavobacteriaceae bacterium]
MKVIEAKKSNIFRILSEAISEGIIIVNENQEIMASNEAADKMFGYEPKELLGLHLNVLIPNNYHASHIVHVKSFMADNIPRKMGHGRDIFGRRKDNSIFPVEAGLNPFVTGGSRYVMALVTDISIRKKQEEQIRNLNHELEQKVEDRTLALQQSVQELKEEIAKRKEAEERLSEALRKERELGDLKTKFLSLVSHEFKTPLSGILTSATLISKYTESDQQERREKHLKTIKSKVKHLDTILSDFLSMERLETGKTVFRFDTFPLSRVMNEVLYSANMFLKDGQHIIYPDNIDDIFLYFDEKILELSLSNLVTNAVKYSPENSVIKVVVEPRADFIIISITDQGIGIPAVEQKHIFDRYFRAENALLTQGTGIGLNIVKSYMDALGGDITFESEENKGSTFSLKVPTTNPNQP